MLCHLKIENYALIYRLNLELSQGLTVITGETGAGKSIILGALGLILGQRADTTVLMDKNQKCLVEGTFNLAGLKIMSFFTENDIDYDEHCILRREINPAGKSRAFINDIPVNLNQLKSFGDMLVDIHSQHAHLLLREATFQLDVLDHFAGHSELLNRYQVAWSEMRSLGKALSELLETERQTRLDEDYYRFLLKELSDSRLDSGEQERIEGELKMLTHAEEVKSALFKASAVMNKNDLSLTGLLNEAVSAISQAASFMPSLKEVEERVRSLAIEAKDISAEIERAEDNVHYDPETIEHHNLRLSELYALQKKHHVSSIQELIGIQESLENKLSKVASMAVELELLDKALREKQGIVHSLSTELTKGRTAVIPEVEKRMLEYLVQMGLPNALLSIEIKTQDSPGPGGCDDITFLFNANKGGELKEIAKVASGGELSRLMLAVKSVVSRQKLMPTIIFDEIDLGISGEVADKVGIILKHLSENLQVIVITHLPQIAARGDYHTYVYKAINGHATHTHIRALDAEERIVEIAKMISGENVSQSAVQTARELLSNH